MIKTHTLIAGYGEVGKALQNVLGAVHYVLHYDKADAHSAGPSKTEFLHIAFPYSNKFNDSVKELQFQTEARHTIIHSTVPVGTCTKLGATHSPVVGIHPHLHESLKTFTKFLGGPKASEVADHFRRAGMKVYICDRSETTELMKLLCTTFYGLCIEFTKETSRLCRENSVPFEAWTLWTENYNSGYEKLGHPEFSRPNLVPIQGKLGGHCVLPNCDLLGGPFSELVKTLNDTNR